MRVLLDTNVIISATATRGLCADVFREVLLSHELIVSEPLLGEVSKTLKEKLGAADDLVTAVIGLLRQDAVVVEPGEPPAANIRDADDIPILASAIAGKAEVFITGDKELLALGSVAGVQIISPRQFWEKLTGGPVGRRTD